MPTPRHKVILNPIPTSFVMLKNVALNVDITIWQRKKHKCILTSKCLHNVWCSLERNKDVGMGAEPLCGRGAEVAMRGRIHQSVVLRKTILP